MTVVEILTASHLVMFIGGLATGALINTCWWEWWRHRHVSCTSLPYVNEFFRMWDRPLDKDEEDE